MATISTFVLLFVIAYTESCIVFPVESENWTVENSNKSIRVAATVPGGIYTDLRNVSVLEEDVFYRLNDQNYRWVSHDNWTYTKTFDVHDNLMAKKNIFLVFHGLDTVSSVYFNNHWLGNTNNMFVRYRFDVKKLLKKTGNTISVTFTSPITAARRYTEEGAYEVPPTCVNKEYNGECHINYLRKMQASFGWDWGPAFPSVGIWKPVTLEGYNNAFGRSISVTTASSGKNWKVSATFYVELPKREDNVTIIMQLMDAGKKLKEITRHGIVMRPDKNLEGKYTINFIISKDKVETWWPNNMGKQKLYYMKCIFRKPDEDTDSGVLMGFRTIELVQDDVVEGEPDKGLTFYFKVNNVPFFAKGSNYIPASVLPELSSNQDSVTRILESAKEANMNMIRVWGGGLYESDYFYYLADTLGLLVWQDMTFACSLYPADEGFLSNVEVEVRQQVRRLQSHPSLAVWTGNNENEGALKDNWYGSDKNFSLFKNDYIRLYVDTIKKHVIREDKSRPFVLSSPSNGKETEEEGGVAKNPSSALYGDVHFYNYYANLWTTKPLPSTRFASEYGIMSMASMETLRTAAHEWELTLDSQVIQSRQHHLGGYSELLIEIAQNLPPIVSSDLETFVYFSQINQAMGIKTQTENYRRLRNSLEEDGRGMTMGALYWQLNDVWQAPSWSSIDFNGKWKMLHYFAKDFFHPVLISPSVTSAGRFALNLISDELIDVEKVTVIVSVYHWCCTTPQYKKIITVDMKAANVTQILQKDLTSLLGKGRKCGKKWNAKKLCFLYFQVKKDGRKIGPDNFVLPSPLHSVFGMKNSSVEVIKVEQNEDKPNGSVVDVTISTDGIAAFVWLEASGVPGHFSENGFLLVSKRKTISFYGDSPIDVNSFKEAVRIKHLASVRP